MSDGPPGPDPCHSSGVRDPLAAAARAAAGGDRTAIQEVLTALAPSILRVVRAVLGRAHPDVEDAAQETLLGVSRALPAFRAECPLVHFASRIAFRTAISFRQRMRSAKDHLDDLRRANEPLTPEPASPQEEAGAARRREAIRALLAELPEVQSETLALRLLLGCSMQEVAAATGAPVNTVRSRIRLAKEALLRRVDMDPELAEALDMGSLTEG